MIEDISLEEKKSPYLTPQNILFTKDKTILIKEIQDNYFTSDHRQIVYESRAAIVSIYDKEQHNLHDIIISKRLQSFTNNTTGLSCYLKDEKLYILSTEIISLGTLDNYCYVIDLNSGKLEKKKIGYNKPSASRVVSPFSTFWFPNECMVSHLYYMAFLGSEKYETILERISYEEIDKIEAIK